MREYLCNNLWCDYIDEVINVIRIDKRHWRILGEIYRHDIFNYKRLCFEMYHDFNDSEILEFIRDHENNKKNKKLILIRKRFPKLIKISQLKVIIKSLHK